MLGWRSFKMSDENKINNDDKDSRKNGEFRVPPKTWIVWIVIIGGILALVLFRNQMTPQPDAIKPQEFLSRLDAGLIESAVLNYSPQSPLYDIVGRYKVLENPADPKSPATTLKPFHVKMPLTDKMLDKLMAYPNVDAKEQNTIVLSVMMTLLPILLIGGFIWFFFIRQIKMAGKGALSFGKSKARLLAKERNKRRSKMSPALRKPSKKFLNLSNSSKTRKNFSASAAASPRAS